MKELTHFLFALFFLTFFHCSVNAQLAVQGKTDLSSYAIDKDGPLYLYGPWEFYWNRLLSPADFKLHDEPPEWIRVPGSWHRQGNHSVLGFATYRLQVVLPENQKGLSLYFPIVNASARIWLNGEFAEEIGTVGTDPDHYFPKLGGVVISIPEKIHDLEIVVQIANFAYFSGGFPRTPQIDRTSAIFTRVNRAHGIENFFAGSLVAMFVYQLILYFLYHRGKPYLWLALICLGVALRSLIVHGGSFLLPDLYPSVPWEYWKKIEFGSIYAIISFFPLYVYHLFIGHAPKRPLYVFCGVAVVLCCVVAVTPQYTYGKLLDVCHIALLAAFVYAVYSIGRAWRAGNEDARIILVGVLASFPFILAEILQNTALFSVNIDLSYMVEMGVLVFLLFQVYLLANHYVKSYKNLELLNQNLEKIVEERTGELRTANTVKDKLLSVMSHDIKSPLNSLRGVLQIYNKGAISKGEFDGFTRLIENDLSKTNNLVENILYWTASQLKGVQVNPQLFELHPLLEDNIQLFQTTASNKKINLLLDEPQKLKFRWDRNILNLVVRNLLANAIKFSHEGGTVSLSVRKEGSSAVIIRVTDDGVGMDEETVQDLLLPEWSMSTTGTKDEGGTGLGLALCREYLKKAGGQLNIESIKGKGSIFVVFIPID